MDREFAEAVFMRWRSGEPVSEDFFFKSASVLLEDNESGAQIALENARFLNKTAAETKGLPPQKGKSVSAPKAPPAQAKPKPASDPLEVTPPAGAQAPQAPAQGAQEAPQQGQEQAPEDEKALKTQEEAALANMDPVKRIKAVSPDLPKELVDRYAKQLVDAEKQMKVPVTDPGMVQKFIDEFKNADLELQKAFLKNFKVTSKEFYAQQSAEPQQPQQGQAQPAQQGIGASSSAPQ